ncbi:MAG: signal transduction histidine kinase [bacterium]|jgi:signal transduction histidine kinase
MLDITNKEGIYFFLDDSTLKDTHEQDSGFNMNAVLEFTQKINASETFKKVFDTLQQISKNQLSINITSLFLFDIKSKKLILKEYQAEQFPLNPQSEVNSLKLSFSSEILSSLRQEHIFFKYSFKKEDSETLQYLEQFQCSVVVPLVFQKKLVGVLLVSLKDPQEKLKLQQKNSEQLFSFLRFIANQTAIVVNNLSNVAELEQGKFKLEKKIFELEAIKELGEVLLTKTNLREASHSFLLIVIGYLVAETGAFYLASENNSNVFNLTSCIGKITPPKSKILSFLSETNELFLKEKFLQKKSELPSDLKKAFTQLDAEVCFPLVYYDELLGLVFFGKKATGLPYRISRLKLASILVGQAAFPFKNSQYYEKVQLSNQELKESRKEIEVANIQLKNHAHILEKTNHKLSLEIKEKEHAEEEIKRLNRVLESRVDERTSQLNQKNKELKETLNVLQNTQDELVQAEKMASLGGLVTGVAHEINTPLGIGLTAASYLKTETTRFLEDFTKNTIRKSELGNLLTISQKSITMILDNLKRASNLVISFKQIAVDQSFEEKRKFLFREYIEHIFVNLKPTLSKTKLKINIIGDEKTTIYSYSGILSQIITNFVINSIIHAYQEGEEGTLTLHFFKKDKKFNIHYSDDGKGISPENLKKIFDPFFTTKRGTGGAGAGLGLHVIFNLIIHKLQGGIKAESIEGEGTTFKIQIPT